MRKLITLAAMAFFLNDVISQEKADIIVQSGHLEGITSTCYSPDEKYVLSSAYSDKTVKLWDVESGKEIRTFLGQPFLVWTACFSPDGKTVLSGGDNIILWDVTTGKTIRTFIGHKGYVHSLHFLSEGKYFISASFDKTIKMWEVATGKEVKTFSGHKNRITSHDISPDEKLVISGSADNEIKLWDITSGKEIKTMLGHTSNITKICFTPDGQHAVSGSFDRTIRVWDITSGKEIKKSEKFPDAIEAVTLSHDGKFILSGFYDGSIRLLDFETLNVIKTFKSQTSKTNIFYSISDVMFSHNDNTFLASSGDRTMTIWDIENSKEVKRFMGHSAWISSISLSKDGKYALSGAHDNTLKLWDLKSGKIIKTLSGHNRWVSSVSLSPDGKYAVSGSYDSTIRLWDIETGKTLRVYKGHTSPVGSVCFSPDGKGFVSGGGYEPDQTIRVWDIENGKEVKILIGHKEYINSVCYSPDGNYVLSSSPDKTVKLWDINKGKLIETFKGHTSNVIDACFSKDGRYILSASDDSTLKIWDVNSRKLIKSIKGKEWNFSVCFSPDGTQLVVGTNSGVIRIFDFATGNEIRSLTGHTQWVNSVKYSPDSKTIVSCSSDNTIKLWDAKSGKLLYSALANGSGSEWLIYSPDGYWDSSPNGGELVAMVNSMSVWNIDQFATKNNRPDRILENIPDANAEMIKNYQSQYRKRLRKQGLTEERLSADFHTPDAKIVESRATEGKAFIRAKFSDDEFSLKRYNIFVNDVPLYGSMGKELSGSSTEMSETIDLTCGNNKIEASCVNEQGVESFRALTYANYDTPVRGDLYFLAFGISKYKNASYNLAFAHKDALDLEKVIQSKKGKGFGNVYTKVLTNEQVTPDAIKASKDFVKNARPDDTFILFIAGHGMHDKDAEATYYYLTSNADINNLKGTAADFETIEDLLQGIPPRNKLFLMDACESGEIDEEDQGQMIAAATGVGIASRGFKSVTPVIASGAKQSQSTKRSYLYQKDRYIYNDLVRRSGAIVFSSSKGGELSYERSDIQNGLFTEYIIKALTTNEADKDGNGIVSTDELRQYVSEQVAKASGDLQHPTVDRDNIYQKFGFGVK